MLFTLCFSPIVCTQPELQVWVWLTVLWTIRSAFSLITQKPSQHSGYNSLEYLSFSTICRKSIENGQTRGKEPQKLCIMHGSNFLHSCFCSTGVQEAPQEHCPHHCLHKARNWVFPSHFPWVLRVFEPVFTIFIHSSSSTLILKAFHLSYHQLDGSATMQDIPSSPPCPP